MIIEKQESKRQKRDAKEHISTLDPTEIVEKINKASKTDELLLELKEQMSEMKEQNNEIIQQNKDLKGFYKTHLAIFFKTFRKFNFYVVLNICLIPTY